MQGHWRWLVLGAALLAGCGGSGQPPPQARPIEDPGFVTDGVLRMHYALTPTLDLPPEIAVSYGIKRRRNLGLLAVALSARDDVADDAEVSAESISLLGERRALAMRSIDEAGGKSYVALVELRHRTPLIIEVRARIAGRGDLLARFTREFHLD